MFKSLYKLSWALCLSVCFPLSAQALSEGDARHLLMRTGLGAAPADIKALKPLSRKQAVERVLHGFSQRPTLHMSFARERPQTRQARRQQFRQDSWQLKLWWHQQLLLTHHPLRERMTLFWHNHFTSSLRKVHRPELMYRQNQLFRQHALGDFRPLLLAVAKDPAMLIYLDGAQNRKAQPNENFARELLELFTLGEGHYREADIKAAARAFTGWSVRQGKFFFRKRQHDTGQKTFLNYAVDDGEDVINVLLGHPRTGRWVVEKLWKAFISPHPDAAVVKYWGRRWQEYYHYDMTRLLRDILNSKVFWQQRGSLIKSPLDLTLGSLRSLGLVPDGAQMQYLTRLNRRLGQDLFEPPNVKGWPGHRRWVDSRTLVLRQQFLARLTRGMERGDGMQHAIHWDAIPLTQWQQRLLPLKPVGSIQSLQDILLDPVFQTK